MLHDLRYLWRSLRKNWLPLGAVVAILGISTGATAAVYAVIDKIVLHPFPIPDGDRVLHLGGLTYPPSVGDPVSFWGQARSLASLAFYSSGGVAVEGPAGRKWLRASVVSADFFHVFGTVLINGRDFDKRDVLPGENRLVIISHSFWRTYFRNRPAVGETVRLNDTPYVIIGIAREDFDYPIGTDLWVPHARDSRNSLRLSGSKEEEASFGHSRGWIGRLRPGSSIEEARSELGGLAKHLDDESLPGNGVVYGGVIGVSGLREEFIGSYWPALRAMLAGAIAILLVAGVNCCIFLLGRAADRRKEIAVRRALGASASRILRQMLNETAVLGVTSGLFGLFTAKVLLVASQRAFPFYLVHMRDSSSIRFGIFAGAMLLALLVGVLAGIIPSLEALSQDFAEALKNDGGSLASARGRMLRRLFIALEITFVFVLTVGAILSLQTASRLAGAQKGYDTKQVYIAHLSIPPRQFSQESLIAKESEIVAAIRALPYVTAVGIADGVPVSGPRGGLFVRHNESEVWCPSTLVAGDYFGAFQIPFVSGAPFSVSRVHEVIISERAAQEFWAGRNPVGDRLLIEGEEQPRQVVGVVRDTRSMEVEERRAPQIYLPFRDPHASILVPSIYLTARCPQNCGDFFPSLLARLKDLGAEGLIDSMTTVEDLAAVVMGPVRVRTTLLTCYALLGIGIAFAGIFGLVSYLSVLRRHEIGIRMVLGAEPVELILSMAKEGVFSAGIGILAGGAASLAGVQVLRNLLFGVNPLDPASFVAAGFFLFIGAILASVIPALWVMRYQPSRLLRVA